MLMLLVLVIELKQKSFSSLLDADRRGHRVRGTHSGGTDVATLLNNLYDPSAKYSTVEFVSHGAPRAAGQPVFAKDKLCWCLLFGRIIIIRRVHASSSVWLANVGGMNKWSFG